MRFIMKCGHDADTYDANGLPRCTRCMGVSVGYDVIEGEPDLAGRQAKCTGCGKLSDSTTKLTYFVYEPDAAYDRYYCGCGRG